jgi:hypothetical protein
MRLGIPKDQAWQWANTRKGYWRTANSPILKNSLTNQYLESQGFPDVMKRYEMLHERIGRLLKLRRPGGSMSKNMYGTVRTVVWEDGHSNNGWPPTRFIPFIACKG